MKNVKSHKLSKSNRNNLIYDAIKKSPKGLTRQELAIQFLDVYGMEQISSATGSLLDASEIFVMGHSTNEKTGQQNEVLGLDYHPEFARVSRKEELQALRDELAAEKARNARNMALFKAYVASIKSTQK